MRNLDSNELQHVYGGGGSYKNSSNRYSNSYSHDKHKNKHKHNTSSNSYCKTKY